MQASTSWILKEPKKNAIFVLKALALTATISDFTPLRKKQITKFFFVSRLQLTTLRSYIWRLQDQSCILEGNMCEKHMYLRMLVVLNVGISLYGALV